MATLNDVEVDSEDWYSLFNLSGQPVGTSMELQIKSVAPVIIRQQSSKPLLSDNNGRVLYDLRTPSGYINITGNEDVWVKCKWEGRTSKISVELV